MMVQNRFINISIFDPPIKVHSPHRKAISHAILHGIVRQFTCEFSSVYPRCKHVLRSGIIAVRIQCTYHLFQAGASFEEWFLPRFLLDLWAALYGGLNPCTLCGTQTIWPTSKPFACFNHISSFHTTCQDDDLGSWRMWLRLAALCKYVGTEPLEML